ncbi:MAG: hypothetical protein M3N68_06955 [Actinomycetota bacterium]|nr:hypothetical protein [Actinomycetota bacterium]
MAGRVGREASPPRALSVAVAVLLATSTAVLATHDVSPLVAPARAAEPDVVGSVLGVPGQAGVVPPTLPVAVPPLPPVPSPDPGSPLPAAPLPGLPTKPGPRAVPAGVGPYRGLGTWVDVYDWSRTYTNGQPRTSPTDLDAMARAGVQTLYIQASKHDAPGDVLEPDLLRAYLRGARARGISVVAWYLPTLVDVDRDLRRLEAIAALDGVDGVAVDIEARDVSDVPERNRRLVELSRALRQALPDRTLGAIVLPPVVLEAISPAYWPAFPYRQLVPSYDVWMTMGYWTNRKAGSEYRDAYRYTRENVSRLRANLGRADAAVHPIGGIGDATTGADVEGYKRAASEGGAIGGSIYDWRTTRGEMWARLLDLRR